MQISRNYFHLIRHPQSGAREHGKLLTALAILSCITVIIPAGFGISYLIGRIKQGAKNPKVSQVAGKIFNHTPVGFPQYGNSCWVASAMQAIISSTHLESLLHKELQPTTITEVIPNPQKWGEGVFNTRDETSEELKQRKTIQQALIALVEVYKRGEETHQALKEFHQSLVDYSKRLYIPSPGKRSDPLEILCLIKMVFIDDIWGWTGFTKDLHDPHKKLKWGEDLAPKILIIDLHDKIPFQANAPLHFNQRPYRIVGAIGGPSGHSMAYVRRGNDWYLCDDGRVRPVSLKDATYTSLRIDRLVLDLIEEN